MNRKSLLRSLLFLAAFCCTGYTWAQLAVGIRGGWNHAWVETVDTRNISNTSTQPINGFNAGATVEYAFNNFFVLRADIYYSQKGYQVVKSPIETFGSSNNTRLPGSDTWTLQMNYIQIPILPTLFYATKKYKFFINTGPYLGYWAWGQKSGTFYINDLGSTSIKSKNVSDAYEFTDSYNSGKQKDNRWDYGWTIGAGLGILVKYGEIFLDFRYVHGFSDAIAFDGTPPTTHTPRLQRNTEITLGFRRMIVKRKPRIKRDSDEEEINYEGEYKGY